MTAAGRKRSFVSGSSRRNLSKTPQSQRGLQTRLWKATIAIAGPPTRAACLSSGKLFLPALPQRRRACRLMVRGQPGRANRKTTPRGRRAAPPSHRREDQENCAYVQSIDPPAPISTDWSTRIIAAPISSRELSARLANTRRRAFGRYPWVGQYCREQYSLRPQLPRTMKTHAAPLLRLALHKRERGT